MKTRTILTVLVIAFVAESAVTVFVTMNKVRDNNRLRGENAALQNHAADLGSQLTELRQQLATERQASLMAHHLRADLAAAEPTEGAAEPLPPQTIVVPGNPVDGSDAAAQLVARDREIANLRSQLDQGRQAFFATNRAAFVERMRSNMERLKAENPEEYDRIQQERK
jgi:hypothetical protein